MIFFESNLEVITWFFVLLKKNIILSNYGFIVTTLLLFVPIIANLFLYSHLNDFHLYVFRDLIICKYNPPLRKGNTMEERRGMENNNRNLDSRSKSLRRTDIKKTKANTIIPNGAYEKNFNRNNWKLGAEL